MKVNGWQKDGEDYNGKEQAEVFFISINGGREKAVSKSDLIKVIKMNLPERGEETDEMPRPLLERMGNGVDS